VIGWLFGFVPFGNPVLHGFERRQNNMFMGGCDRDAMRTTASVGRT